MHVTGIIAEYNPLHLGHEFHIKTTRDLIKSATSKSPDEPHYVITVLSGDFVQRGLPAILDKHTRARMALEAGSDLVLELPVPYVLSSGEGFAFGGVSLLHQLGCVDTLSFGSEAGELNAISSIARILNDMEHSPSGNPSDSKTVTYHTYYQAALKQGLAHPLARLKALQEAYPEIDTSVLDGHSNNMLALEYCKAVYRLNSPIQPITIKRHGQDYLENNISDCNRQNLTTTAHFASATAIREALKQHTACNNIGDTSADHLSASVSPSVQEVLLCNQLENKLIYPDDFSALLHYKLLTLSKEELSDYLEITPDFANKLCKNLGQFESFTQFSNLLWTKNLTYARVCRNLMNIILDIKKDTWNVHQPVPYARVLGFRKESAPLLTEIKKKSTIPLITKLADAEKVLTPDVYGLLELDIHATHIYDSILLQKSGQKPLNEFQKQLLTI